MLESEAEPMSKFGLGTSTKKCHVSSRVSFLWCFPDFGDDSIVGVVACKVETKRRGKHSIGAVGCQTSQLIDPNLRRTGWRSSLGATRNSSPTRTGRARTSSIGAPKRSLAGRRPLQAVGQTCSTVLFCPGSPAKWKERA